MRGTKARAIRKAVDFSVHAERPMQTRLMKTVTFQVPDPTLPLTSEGTLQLRTLTSPRFMVVNQLGSPRRLYQFMKAHL